MNGRAMSSGMCEKPMARPVFSPDPIRGQLFNFRVRRSGKETENSYPQFGLRTTVTRLFFKEVRRLTEGIYRVQPNRCTQRCGSERINPAWRLCVRPDLRMLRRYWANR